MLLIFAANTVWAALRFKYTPSENRFSSKENMNFITLYNQRDFVMSIKSDRTFALSDNEKKEGRFVIVDL